MDKKAFALAFTLWLEDVKENEDEFQEMAKKLPLEERAEEMASVFEKYLEAASLQIGELK